LDSKIVIFHNNSYNFDIKTDILVCTDLQTALAKNMFLRLNTGFVVDGHICRWNLVCWSPFTFWS